jgi:putative endonuclease
VIVGDRYCTGKELKKWRRDWKVRLIEEQNPEWADHYRGITN